MLVIVGAETEATKVAETRLVWSSVTVTDCEKSWYPVFCNRMVLVPLGTFSMTVGVDAPVEVPFKKIVAPAGVELTDILPTAATTAGKSRMATSVAKRRKHRIFIILAIHSIKRKWESASDIFY